MVDVDDLVEVFDPIDALVSTRRILGPMQCIPQGGREDVADERTLAAAANSRDRDKATQRDFHVDVFKVVVPRATDCDRLSVPFASFRRSVNLTCAIEETAGYALRISSDVLDRTCGQ